MKPNLKTVPTKTPTYAVVDEARALAAHPKPEHAAKWFEAVGYLRDRKVSRWIMDNPIARTQ
jgi:hypothetical protein